VCVLIATVEPMQRSIFPPQLTRIPEDELTMEKLVGEGAFSVVWRATWQRKITVGRQQVHSVEVAVKMSNRAYNHTHDYNNNQVSNELARDLAVISGLPHQNILTLLGVCEPATSTNSNNKGQQQAVNPKIVYELMSTDLAHYLVKQRQQQQQQQQQQQSPSSSPSEFKFTTAVSASSPSSVAPTSTAVTSTAVTATATAPCKLLLPTHVLLRVLRDVSAGLAHLHSHGVIHRDVKPANVLLRDEQVKLCDFGSSKDLQHSIQQMSVAGTLDYMAPEVLHREPAGRAADVWSFGVLLFECVTGRVCTRKATQPDLLTELKQLGCLPDLIRLFDECRQEEPSKRPSMAAIHFRLQQLVMQDANDSQRLKEELKRAEAQDRDTYDSTWNACYANDACSQELLAYARELQRQLQAQRQGCFAPVSSPPFRFFCCCSRSSLLLFALSPFILIFFSPPFFFF